MSSDLVDVAIVGAGPYALSIAAHLKSHGVGLRIFGYPMRTWFDMPASLNLKSFAFATSIYTPQKHYTFPEYCRARGLEDFEPCTMHSFAEYGLWVQRRLIPEVEPAVVTRVTATGSVFAVSVITGETFRARHVVVAVGVYPFARKPDVLTDMPAELVSHTCEHKDFAAFAGKDVAVIGAGASAVEAAVLLREAGARSQLLVRGEAPTFHAKMDRNRPLLERLRAPNSVLGPGRWSWALDQFPWAPYYVPEGRRVRFTKRYLGPAGPWWLRDRFVGKVPVFPHCEVLAADRDGAGLVLRVGDASRGQWSTRVDHVVAGTGYEPDVDRLHFLDGSIRSRIRRIEQAPALTRHFESSVPGLYFAGPVTAYSFGPMARFVAGAEYAAPTLARHIARRAEPTLRFTPISGASGFVVRGSDGSAERIGASAQLEG